MGVFVAAMAALALASDVLFAQGRTELPRVTDIQVTGLQRVGLGQVLSAIKLKVGDVVTPQAVNDDIRRLDQLGFFHPVGIDVRQEPYQDGLRLIFNLHELPVASSVTFSGSRVFPEKKLLSVIGISPGSHVDPARLRVATSNISDLYHEQGHQSVEVVLTQEENAEENSVALTFVIQEGPRTFLRKIVFEGNRAFSASRLKSFMTTRTRWLAWGGVFDLRAFELDLDRLTQFYKDQGYLDATVTGDLRYSADRKSLTAVVTVEEGPRYRVSAVRLEGNQAFTAEELAAALHMKEGDYFTAVGSDRDYQGLYDFYGSRGYIDVGIERGELFPEAGQVEVVYQIIEKGVVRLGRIDIRNNFKTQDKVIRREFRVYPGEVMDVNSLRVSINRLRELRYFNKVETSFAEGPAPDTRTLVVDVEEGRTGQVLFGVGAGSDSGIIGDVSVDMRNFDIADLPTSLEDFFSGNAFTGAGQRLLLQLRPGTITNQARLYFSEPYLFDSPFSFSSDLFYYEREQEDYDETRTGVRLALGRRFSDALIAQLTARVERVRIDSVQADSPPEFFLLEGDSDIHSFILAADCDKTDSLFNPSTGYRLSGSVELADEALGSDFSFVKVNLEGQGYRTLHTDRDGRKHILILRGRVGAVDRTHGADVPFFERFYAGGRESMRGFAYRGVGPHVNGDPVGGEWIGLGTVEYSFPLLEDSVRGALFTDFGTVGRDLDSLDARVRAGVGFGLRFYLPNVAVPIAIDFAVPINADDDDETEVFSFAAGTIF